MKALAIAFVLTLFFNPGEEPDEIIRRKIENRSINGIEAVGEKILCEKGVSEFYSMRIFEAAWTEATALELISQLEKAGSDGLNPNDYHTDVLAKESRVRHKTASEEAEYDLLLTDAFLLYVSHMLSGKVNPVNVDAEWHVVRREGDPMLYLKQAISSGQVARALEAASPKHAVYESMKAALAIYRSIEDQPWPEIAEGPTIKPKGSDERLPGIRQKLVVLGDLESIYAGESVVYDDTLKQAVIKFQLRHGLDAEGEIGAKTRAALNVSPANRVKQLRINLERWRWLPQEFGDFYIKVNIAAFEMEVVKNGEVARRHKVIVGKSFRQTPVFSSKMQYLVINPTWTIPPGILNNDVIPGVKKDPGYLAKKNIAVLDQNGNTVNTADINWSDRSVRSYTYRQPAGPDNALGAVKFMFPNSFHVYLHDTPSRDLFAKSERALSSGCIRVERPLELAKYLLADSVMWNGNKIDQIVSTRKTQTVQLKEQPNVHLLYWTAWIDSAGLVHFRNDIYERDEAVYAELIAAPLAIGQK